MKLNNHHSIHWEFNTSWWFHFFYVHPYLGKIPILTNIFQRGLKPPTRFCSQYSDALFTQTVLYLSFESSLLPKKNKMNSTTFQKICSPKIHLSKVIVSPCLTSIRLWLVGPPKLSTPNQTVLPWKLFFHRLPFWGDVRLEVQRGKIPQVMTGLVGVLFETLPSMEQVLKMMKLQHLKFHIKVDVGSHI